MRGFTWSKGGTIARNTKDLSWDTAGLDTTNF